MSAEPLDQFSIRPDIDASLQMLATLGQRRAYLAERQFDTIAQITHRAATAWRAREIDDVTLRDIYLAMRSISPVGWSKTWQEEDLPQITTLNTWIARHSSDRGPEADGSWQGTYPRDPDGPCPRKGQSVVYVLYDDQLDPVYLGSTHHLTERLKRHRRDGKRFSYWRAFPCRTREEAYALEDQMLKGSLPKLNRKAGR